MQKLFLSFLWSLFAQKMFLETSFNMIYCQFFQAIATKKFLLQLHEKITQRPQPSRKLLVQFQQ